MPGASGRGGIGAGDENSPLIRSEEALWIATRWCPTHRVRLRKRIVTEMVTKTIPVRREEVSLEYEPVDPGDDGRPTPGPEPTGGRWMVLHREEVVLTTQCVPVERVRLVTEKITETREVSETLRKEQIDVDHRQRSE